MPRRPFIVRAARRGMSLADRPLSFLEARANGLSYRSRPTFPERIVLGEIGWALGRPDTVVYDIGAATGVYAVAAAKVETVRRVVAFEPLADSFAALSERSKDYPVQCFNVALADENGEAEIHRSEWRNTSSFLDVGELTRKDFPDAARLEANETVRVVRLDDLAAEFGLDPPDVVKMDVQGFEDRVVRGGTRTLAGARVCIVELSFQRLYDGAPLFDDVYPLLLDLGFRTTGFGAIIRARDGSMISADVVFERADAM